MLEQPQRHRENTEPPTHVANTKTRRHEGITKADHPSTQSRREAHARLHCAARFRPSDDGREPLGRAIALNASVRCGVPAQRPALSKRRPRHSSSPIFGWKVPPLPNRREGRRNRRAAGAPVGEKPGSDGCLHPERRDFSPATGDHPIACRSAANPRHHRITSATNPLCLRVFVFATWARASASLPSVFLLCASVPLWFSRFRTIQHS